METPWHPEKNKLKSILKIFLSHATIRFCPALSPRVSRCWFFAFSARSSNPVRSHFIPTAWTQGPRNTIHSSFIAPFKKCLYGFGGFGAGKSSINRVRSTRHRYRYIFYTYTVFSVVFSATYVRTNLVPKIANASLYNFRFSVVFVIFVFFGFFGKLVSATFKF